MQRKLREYVLPWQAPSIAASALRIAPPGMAVNAVHFG